MRGIFSLLDKHGWKRRTLRSAMEEYGISRPHVVRPFMRRQLKLQYKDLSLTRQLVASSESVEYADRKMRDARIFYDRPSHIRYALEHANSSGLVMEFGVFSGVTINIIAKYRSDVVHGFDSFKGLPADFIPEEPAGTFDTGGSIPKVRENVRLHAGLFEQTLPTFVRDNPGDASFIHIDCDLYSSTKTVFSYLSDRIKAGSIILFDEYFNYPGWKNHEFRAFQEFVTEAAVTYEYLSFNERGEQVAVKIVSKGNIGSI